MVPVLLLDARVFEGGCKRGSSKGHVEPWRKDRIEDAATTTLGGSRRDSHWTQHLSGMSAKSALRYHSKVRRRHWDRLRTATCRIDVFSVGHWHVLRACLCSSIPRCDIVEVAA